MSNKHLLLEFIEQNWDEAFAYMTRDIADQLGCDTRNARYYLTCMVDEGRLGQIKYWGKTWYVKRHQLEQFKQFTEIGVKIR
jgi:hypothetical protein